MIFLISVGISCDVLAQMTLRLSWIWD